MWVSTVDGAFTRPPLYTALSGFRRSWFEAGGARRPHQRIHSPDFLFQRTLAQAGEPIVPAPFVHIVRRGRYGDPSLIQQTLQRTVQRPGSHADMPVGLTEHFF